MPSWVPTSVGWQLLTVLFAVNCLGEVGIPIPLVFAGVLLFVGFLIAQGFIAEGASVLAVSIVGSVAGSVALYAIARWVGADALVRLAARMRLGRWVRIPTDGQHPAPGFLTVIQSRLVPGLALPTSVAAGLTKASLRSFTWGVVISEAIAITPIVAIGFALGSTAGNASQLASRVPLILGGLAVALLAGRFAWRRRRRA